MKIVRLKRQKILDSFENTIDEINKIINKMDNMG